MSFFFLEKNERLADVMDRVKVSMRILLPFYLYYKIIHIALKQARFILNIQLFLRQCTLTAFDQRLQHTKLHCKPYVLYAVQWATPGAWTARLDSVQQNILLTETATLALLTKVVHENWTAFPRLQINTGEFMVAPSSTLCVELKTEL